MYRFGFCVTIQIVLINTIVLMLGLFHILNDKVIPFLFYGTFLISAGIRVRNTIICGEYFNGGKIKNAGKEKLQSICTNIRSKGCEYIVLFLVVVFGMAYFSYGAFQVRCYGQTDLMVHHQWTNRIVQGDVFSGGIYPQAMHCFVYCLHMLFGIRIYSIMMFLQGIHIMVFLLSVYCLLREIFYWRWSSIFVLGLYLTMDINTYGCQYSIYRLQMTLPLEFGLHTQFLCALYLIRHLKYTGQIKGKEQSVKLYWDENLFLFMMSLASSIAIHYQTTIMAFIICASVALIHIKKMFCRKHLIPLILSALCGIMIAGTPVVTALAFGISFEGSINWGLKSISGNKKDTDDISTDQKEITEEVEVVRGPLDPNIEDLRIIESLPDIGQWIAKGVIRIEYFVKGVFNRGYKGMYGEKRGRWIFAVTIVAVGFCIIGKRCAYVRKICNGYLPIILVSFLSMIVYMAYESPGFGLPVLITGNRYNSSAHMLVLAVVMMPADIIFSTFSYFLKERALQFVSIIFTAGIYIGTNLFGIYHEFLYYSLTRYDSAVLVTESIIEKFPQNSYTVISPYEELCQVALYGKHEDLHEFILKCEQEEEYCIPSEYVFIYVEKKPIVYRQLYYFSGPAWLGKSRDSKVLFSKISREAAGIDISDYARSAIYGEGRTILESKAYEWCQSFSKKYPSVLKVYYEEEKFLCYYFKQNVDETYNLAVNDP